MAPEVKAKLEELATVITRLSQGAEDARLRAIYLCDALKLELERPEETLLRTFWAQPAHHLAIRMGIQWKLFHTLDQSDGAPKTSEQLAASSGADPDLVVRILRHLAAMGTLLEVDVETFSNTAFSKNLTVQAFEDLVIWMFDHFTPVTWKTPAFLAETNCKNPTNIKNTVFQYALDIPGKSMYEYMHENPSMAIQFGSMMSVYAAGKPMWWDPGYYPVQERLGNAKGDEAVLLVDIGGGGGGELAMFRAVHSALKGRIVLQDLSHVVEQSENLGFEVMSYNWNDPQPIKGARAYMLHHILHNHGSDEDCQHILNQIIPAMERGYSKILVKELMLPDKDAGWLMSALDVEIMQSLAGKERTELQWRKLLESVGLKIEGIFRHEMADDSVIEAVLA